MLIHDDPVLEHLTIDAEPITTTPEHPFYTAERGWVGAGKLWVGAHVRKAGGSTGIVRAVAEEQHVQKMYNLTVEGAHTFFVGGQRWLVHNCAKRAPKPDPRANEIAMPNGYKREAAQYTAEPPASVIISVRSEQNPPIDVTCPGCNIKMEFGLPNVKSMYYPTFDHIVSLEEAYQRGGSTWSRAQWKKFANDLRNQIIVCRSCNSSKQNSTRPYLDRYFAAWITGRREVILAEYGLIPDP